MKLIISKLSLLFVNRDPLLLSFARVMNLRALSKSSMLK